MEHPMPPRHPHGPRPDMRPPMPPQPQPYYDNSGYNDSYNSGTSGRFGAGDTFKQAFANAAGEVIGEAVGNAAGEIIGSIFGR